MKLRLFRGTGRFGPMSASAPPYVGRLHGVLAVLPSTRIASVAHAGLMQSFPSPSAFRLPPSSLSVVVPTLSEAASIVSFLQPLQRLRERGVELILADGGSRDGT